MADELLYGGAGGGGKSDLLCGLALTKHKRSLIMRRQYTDLGAIIERAIEINGTRKGFNGAPPPKLRTDDGRLVEFGAAKSPGDEQSWQGQPHDNLSIDEITQFLESQIRMLMGWVRSTVPGQRCRTVFATNPPVSTDGDWIIGMFRPWLDVTYENPALPGELRWFVVDPDGKDVEVDGPQPHQFPGEHKPVKPKSRTFIPAFLRDNPYLVNTDYDAQLDALPEPWRSAVRDGNFMASRADDVMQVIPSDWIRQAQKRWRPINPPGTQMSAIGFDVAQSIDQNILAPRYGGWYSELITVPGKEAPDGSSKAALVIKYRRGNAALIIDAGGGYAGALIERLKDNKIQYTAFNGSNTSTAKTKDGTLHFLNKRAESWWAFREALDPDQDGGSPIELPPDRELEADLATPRFDPTPRGIVIESKDKIRDRIGRSPDKGDAVVMAWCEGEYAIRRGVTGMNAQRPKRTDGYAHLKRKRRRKR